MTAADPQLQFRTLYVLDARQRIASTREPHPTAGPALAFVRGVSSCAWAVRADVPDDVAEEVGRLAGEESPTADWRRPLRHADQYATLLGRTVRSGPAFAFPDNLLIAGPTLTVDDERDLADHFRGWIPGEIAAGRAPMRAVLVDGRPVSVCFCARRSAFAAEAGVETAAAFRGRGYAVVVTGAWAREVRGMGLTPIYSTDWSNLASLAVAKKLLLVPFAADFSVDQ